MLKSNFEPHIFTEPLFPLFYDKSYINYTYNGPMNWHSNIELIYCISGSGTVICDTRKQSISVGEIVIVNSLVSHGVYTDSEITYYYLIIDEEFCNQNGISTTKLNFLEHLNAADLAKAFLDVSNAIENKEQRAENIRYAMIRCKILSMLILLCEKYTTKSIIERSVTDNITFQRVKAAMVYIQNNFSDPLTLENVATHIGVCKNHLSRKFKEYTNLTVVEYINYTRCKYAQMHILNNYSISEAATTCGFNNLSYFTRTYKKYMGNLPSKIKTSP